MLDRCPLNAISITSHLHNLAMDLQSITVENSAVSRIAVKKAMFRSYLTLKEQYSVCNQRFF
jgi:hypothetical protein